MLRSSWRARGGLPGSSAWHVRGARQGTSMMLTWPAPFPLDQSLHQTRGDSGIKAVIPEPADQRGHRRHHGSAGGRPVSLDPGAYQGRNVIERQYAHLKQWRGLATRYDQYSIACQAAALLNAVIAWSKRLSGTPAEPPQPPSWTQTRLERNSPLHRNARLRDGYEAKRSQPCWSKNRGRPWLRCHPVDLGDRRVEISERTVRHVDDRFVHERVDV